MKIYKILSVLLQYPEQELLDNLEEIKDWVNDTSDINKQERSLLQGYLKKMESNSLIELQANYVSTFDMVPEHSLHLTHHLFGDDKNRGPALIDLGELYKDYGIEVSESAKELPDYLPLILEFAAYLDGNESTVFLADAKKVFGVLMDNLKKAASPYADLISIIDGRASLTRIEAS
ncbi:MAG: nitrate reductase molybdenum cofactor assembly chaperone [Piscirickettsiaceae bacterium]|nr:nitrate reductase molybdenum cofactor assembly chaperone [Piscirickettsiaceae bacterium]